MKKIGWPQQPAGPQRDIAIMRFEIFDEVLSFK
jgi:hypothetical protein